MRPVKKAHDSTGRIVAMVVALVVCLFVGLKPTLAEGTAAVSPAPDKLHQLLDLLDDPEIKAWIARQRPATPVVKPAEVQDPAPKDPAPTASSSDSMMPSKMSKKLGGLRRNIIQLAMAVPAIPDEFMNAWMAFQSDLGRNGGWKALVLVGTFIVLGFGVRLLYYQLIKPARNWLINGAVLDAVGDRIRVVMLRFCMALGAVVAFMLGSIGAFLTLDWPSHLKVIVLAYLVASVIVQLAVALGLFLLSAPSKYRPNADRYRIVPITATAALFWNKRIVLAVAWISYGSVTIEVLGRFGFSTIAQTILFNVLDLGLLVIGLEMLWRAPADQGHEGVPILWERLNRPTIVGLASAYFISLWLVWLAGYPGIFSVLLVAVCLPVLMVIAQRSVNHILRPTGEERQDYSRQTIGAVILERGVRAALIVGAAAILGSAWQLDITTIAMEDTLFTRILRYVLNAIVIGLAADLIWHIARVTIDMKLRSTEPAGAQSSEAASHQARMRTLLPILRNALFFVIMVLAVMMALSSMGVQIGPLIASAGVVGVAVGFGSQTLVKDIISGIFYLLDDAFRVGEYIQSGNYKGVVESFSLRSVKLRHQRGPIYTVPFGSLGAVQNMSRDWTIDKMSVNVAYTTDLAKVKGLIKEIGKALLQDEDCAPHIIETLKLQGVESFVDYGIHLRMKMTTKPGEQFIVRRRALGMIKHAFDANGISFATPTVHVGNGTEPAYGAAARQSLELVKARASSPAA